MNAEEKKLKMLFEAASASIDAALSPGSVKSLENAEGNMVAFLDEVYARPEARAFVTQLFFDALDGPNMPWEFLQFCFHDLRWPELKARVTELRDRNVSNIRMVSVLHKLLDAFNDDWEDADFYKRFGKKK